RVGADAQLRAGWLLRADRLYPAGERGRRDQVPGRPQGGDRRWSQARRSLSDPRVRGRVAEERSRRDREADAGREQNRALRHRDRITFALHRRRPDPFGPAFFLRLIRLTAFRQALPDGGGPGICKLNCAPGRAYTLRLTAAVQPLGTYRERPRRRGANV